MTVDNHSLTRLNADALAGFYIDNLKRAKSLDLHLVVLLQLLQDKGKEL